MYRLFIALLLLLALQPAPHVAAQVARGSDSLRPAKTEYAHDFARPTGGLELTRTLGAEVDLSDRRSQPPDTDGRFGRTTVPDGIHSSATPSRFTTRTVAPLCERLPYYATAPPLQR